MLLLGLALILSSNFCAAQPRAQSKPAPQSTDSEQYVYGTWYSYPPGNPETDAIRHEFRHNVSTNRDEMIVTRLCPGNYRAVIARAVSPVEISGSTIRVLKAATAIEKGELNSECKASIEPGFWSYTVSEDHDRMTITDPGGTPDIIELARQDAVASTVLPSNVFGTWSLPLQIDHESKVKIRLVFYAGADSSKGKVRQIATCMKGNDTLVSQADSDIEVSSDHIKILNSASHVQKDGPFTCKVTITPGTLRYVISSNGSTMTLSSSGGAPLKLTRDQNPGLN